MCKPTQPARLSVGVTGHRDIDPDSSLLGRSLLEVLAEVGSVADGRPVEICSALAEGADRLVAEKAIQRLDAGLTAVLPMPAEEYARDFAEPDSGQAFRDLLGRARQVVELPVLGDQLDRSRQYALAGAWLVAHCPVLVAIWDGRAPRGHGGTAEVVQWMSEGRIPEALQLAQAGTDRDLPVDRLLLRIDPASGRVSRFELD
jgi:hypothetical protein